MLLSFLTIILLAFGVMFAPVAIAQADVTAPPPNLLETPPAPNEAPAPQVVTEPAPAPVAAQTGLTPELKAVEAPAPAAVPVDPDLFFDAEALTPKRRGDGTTRSPITRTVNPEETPASRVIIVNKDAKQDSTAAKLVAADRAAKLGRYDAALEMYEDLYEKNKRDPRILMGRATTMQHLGQYDGAMQTYQQLVDLKPDNLEAKLNMLGLLATKYPSVALRELLDLREKAPQNAGVVAQIAVTQAQLGNLDDALKYLAMASGMEPRNAGHLYNMGVIADRGGKMTDAIVYYEKALETDSVYGRGQSIPREAIYERLAQIR